CGPSCLWTAVCLVAYERQREGQPNRISQPEAWVLARIHVHRNRGGRTNAPAGSRNLSHRPVPAVFIPIRQIGVCRRESPPVAAAIGASSVDQTKLDSSGRLAGA